MPHRAGLCDHRLAGIALGPEAETGASAKLPGKPPGTALICSECLVLCDEIITEEDNLSG